MNPKQEPPAPVPEWLLERLAAGELPPARAAELTRRLAQEPNGQARRDRIAASDAEILAAYPAVDMASRIRDRANLTGAAGAVARPPSIARASHAAKGRRLWIVGAPTLVAAAAVLVLWSRPRPTTPVEENAHGPGGVAPSASDSAERAAAGDGERIKGLQPLLRVYRKRGEAVERLVPGATTHAGDRLQVSYVAAGHRFGAVLSVDGAGHVTFHLPSAPAADAHPHTGGAPTSAATSAHAIAEPAARLRLDGEVALPDAYELDAAPGFEQFVFVAGDAPFDISTLAQVVRGTATPPPGTSMVSFTVRKE